MAIVCVLACCKTLMLTMPVYTLGFIRIEYLVLNAECSIRVFKNVEISMYNYRLYYFMFKWFILSLQKLFKIIPNFAI